MLVVLALQHSHSHGFTTASSPPHTLYRPTVSASRRASRRLLAQALHFVAERVSAHVAPRRVQRRRQSGTRVSQRGVQSSAPITDKCETRRGDQPRQICFINHVYTIFWRRNCFGSPRLQLFFKTGWPATAPYLLVSTIPDSALHCQNHCRIILIIFHRVSFRKEPCDTSVSQPLLILFCTHPLCIDAHPTVVSSSGVCCGGTATTQS